MFIVYMHVEWTNRLPQLPLCSHGQSGFGKSEYAHVDENISRTSIAKYGKVYLVNKICLCEQNVSHRICNKELEMNIVR